MVTTLGELYLRSREALLETEEPQMAGQMARDLVSTLSGRTQEQFLVDRDREAPEELVLQVLDGVDRLKRGEPLPYVLGEWTFYGLPMVVSPDVLIPRDDTCALAELAIHRGLFLEKDPRILDLCCGSGCIGIAAAHEVEDARVLAVDLSDGALRLTRENAHRLGVSGRLLAMKADATMPPPGGVGPFDIIVSNPPYITRSEMAQLDHSVADFEPHEALYGGVDGLDFYRAICENWGDTLAHGGILLFECGWKQADAVAEILQKYGFSDVCIEKDDAGVPRIVIGRSPREDDDLTK